MTPVRVSALNLQMAPVPVVALTTQGALALPAALALLVVMSCTVSGGQDWSGTGARAVLLTTVARQRGQRGHRALHHRLPAFRRRGAAAAPSLGWGPLADLRLSTLVEGVMGVGAAMVGRAGTAVLGVGAAGAAHRSPGWWRTGRHSGPLETRKGFGTDSGGTFASS